MVGADEELPIRQTDRHTVAESRTWTNRRAALTEKLKIRVERDLAQRHDDADAWQRGELGIEVRAAVDDLLRRRRVVGRRTAHSGGDEDITQRQAVVDIVRRRDVGESR